MKTMWMFVFMVLPFAGLAYAMWHVWHVLPFANVWRWGFVLLFTVAFLMIFLNFSGAINRMPLNLASAVYEVGNSMIFILLYLVILFLLLDASRLLHVLPRQWLCSNGYTAAAITVVMLVLFIGGNAHYRHKERRELLLTTDKPLEKDLKIVMLSDLHIGYHNRRAELHRWVDMINAEHPDLVLIGGDIIDISVRPLIEERCAEEFRRLQAPAYACLGNHEYYSGEPLARKFYADAGITLLRDSIAYDQGIRIVGRDDRTNTHRRNLQSILRGGSHDATPSAAAAPYTILLDHQPYFLEQAERAGVDFQFSGHTHYGQVWPISWITRMLYECSYGPHQRGKTRYYISSGMGIWGGKFRIGTCSEYVVATLRSGKGR